MFDKVIGYENVKLELTRICDIIKNSDKYEKLGVSIPKGLLLYGEPGVGKTLFANSFIEECNIRQYICRKNLPNKEFINFIKQTFDDAKANAPSIILLDDFDKFANEDKDHKNETYIDDIQTAYHEAGHTLISELLNPGSVVMVSVGAYEGSSIGGFTKIYRGDKRYRTMKDIKTRVLCLLGGKCATEVKYGIADIECSEDIRSAFDLLRDGITLCATKGFDKCHTDKTYCATSYLNREQEKVLANELTNYYAEVKQMLVENRELLDELALQLNEKKLLVAKDIETIMNKRNK